MGHIKPKKTMKKSRHTHYANIPSTNVTGLQPYRLYKYINNIIRTFFTTCFESYACALIAKYKANSFKKPSQDNNEAGRSMNFLLLSHYFLK